MKLLIDIPEDSYKATCNGCMLPPDVENVVQGIKYGTPLDDVKAEIEASKWTDKNIRIERNALASGLEKAIEILDNIGKAESEDKE